MPIPGCRAQYCGVPIVVFTWSDNLPAWHNRPDTMECNIYLKNRESDVKILGQAPVPLVGLLHEREKHVFLTWFLRIIPFNLDPVLRISPEAVWKTTRETRFVHIVSFYLTGWSWINLSRTKAELRKVWMYSFIAYSYRAVVNCSLIVTI